MILSLQNTLSETQAPSRLAVLRQECFGRVRPVGQGTGWHRSYPLSTLLPIFGGTAGFESKPACRIPAASLLTRLASARSAFGDTSVNAVNAQEGTP